MIKVGQDRGAVEDDVQHAVVDRVGLNPDPGDGVRPHPLGDLSSFLHQFSPDSLGQLGHSLDLATDHTLKASPDVCQTTLI